MADTLMPYGYLDGVNRSVLIVTPREPYLGWVRAAFVNEPHLLRS
jgi:hypothetical protein